MSVHYVVHDAAGKIVNAGHCQDHMVAAQALAPGDVGMETDAPYDGRLYYVVASAIVARPAFSLAFDKTSLIANGTDTATLTGLPAGSKVGSHPVNDGVFTFASFVPGSYSFAIEAFPMQPGSLTLTVV
jgi:hypothetical protein